MNLQITPHKLEGSVSIPSSKSMTHRAIICAALAGGTSLLTGIDYSKDIDATLGIMAAFGADFRKDGSSVTMQGIHQPAETAVADCCESGSTLRFLIPVAAALGIRTEFHGQGRLPQRPITPYIRELSQKGITFHYDNTMPFVMEGKLQSGVFHLEGDISSQFITGLLFALPLLDGDSEIVMTSPLQSKPYADMTIDCMRKFGVEVEETPEGNYRVRGNQVYRAADVHMEGDFSQAAFFYVANAIGNEVVLENIPEKSVQGDRKIVEIIGEMCYNRNNGKNAAFHVDASDIPDLVPILAVLGTFGDEVSVITGAERLRIKESDRLTAVSELLNRLGGKVIVHEDGLEIHPVPQLHGGTVDSFGDHRIAMCAAIAATRCTAPVTILGAECVEKSYPAFFEDYQHLGGIANGIILE
ncbi:MAG: 3-phosphoshikimate 1-carboxyvinyltransferase [Oscillospiraceae bacterium]|nr:3-phosphoshikimate 1-carboxyvinyltransferase [Oscillospiraceae bacterium]